jgi:chaperonin GroES
MIAFKKLRPLMNRVLIQKAEPLTKTKGGILLPESKQEQLNFGKVVAVGPGRALDNGQIRPCSVKEGDTVLLPEYGGSKVTLGDNQEYYLYRDDDLMGTLSEPTK